MDINENEDLVAVQNILLGAIESMVSKGIKPMAIAGMMANISLQMYKTALSTEEYNLMVDYISNNRGRIKEFQWEAADLLFESLH
ncbi:hypothetical protein EBT25_08735 [bacterium]|nr:hypothetical protein [bacterium]